MRRREFLQSAGITVSALALSPLLEKAAAAALPAGKRPNILWISAEDISPDLGCYGDSYAATPNLDAFAAQATRYDACFAHMGVCAPARSGIITGMYPTAIGTNHMRCSGVPAPEVRCFPEYLRAAGYYCSNHSKTDYQFASPATAWDRNGGAAWWRGRGDGQPFFCVINFGGTHESQARCKPDAKLDHDPAAAKLPPYYPDTTAVRRDWAKYYDNLTAFDRFAADVLRQLEEDGLAEDTIVWVWGDHGRGLPRGKRWLYDSGLRVPLLLRVPTKYRELAAPDAPRSVAPGTHRDELVSFLDFAPTMLSLCGLPVPGHMQGQAFLGPQASRPRTEIYAARDRVDEAIDTIRAVRDRRFKYIRNFQPHLPRSLDVAYMNEMPTMAEMRRLFAEGALAGAQLQYFESPKPIEELYDLETDPHEVRNLAGAPEHGKTLERLRLRLFDWLRQTGDSGLLPEPEFDQLKRPGDEQETAAAPGVAPEIRDGKTFVALTCATPGASIAYQVVTGQEQTGAGGVALTAEVAKIHGPQPWPRRNETKFTAWRNSKAWLSWSANLPAGRVPVHVIWACGGREDSVYRIQVADQELEGRSRYTGGWDSFQAATLGDVQIPKAGLYEIRLKPVEKDGVFQMDLQQVIVGGKAAPSAAAAQAGPQPWLVYTGPVPLDDAQGVRAKTCRLGFRDSPVIEWRAGDGAIAAAAANGRPHWRQTLDESGTVPRILALKQLDGTGTAALQAYLRALDDPDASVRFWALLGICQGHDRNPVRARPREEAGELVERVRACLKDESVSVRAVAAQTLCEWGEGESALPVLLKDAREHLLASGRHFAANALYLLGERARPALAAVEEIAAGKDYAARASRNLLGQLREAP